MEDMQMPRVFLGVGSNVGDRWSCLQLAFSELDQIPGTKLVAKSAVYETAPVGPVEQGRFLNAAIEIRTTLDPEALLTELTRIEMLAGRKARDQRVKWGPRELDLDILLFGDVVHTSERLTVPHPFMHARWFVLKPLADLGPDVVHPVLKKTIAELLADVRE